MRPPRPLCVHCYFCYDYFLVNLYTTTSAMLKVATTKNIFLCKKNLVKVIYNEYLTMMAVHKRKTGKIGFIISVSNGNGESRFVDLLALWQSPTFLGASKPNKYPVSSFLSSAWEYLWNFERLDYLRLWRTFGRMHIVEINLESHNLVKNIPHESTNGGPSTQRIILNVNSQSTGILFPIITARHALLWPPNKLF